jgi:hypothetical protein
VGLWITLGVKLGNGIIIQWGLVTGLTAQNNHVSQTVTLPMAFSSTNYTATIIGANSNNNYGQSTVIKSQTSSSFIWNSSYWHNRDANVTDFRWIAIGY